MRHIAHTIHSDFKLNGQSFSDPKELLELAKHVSDELVGFLEDWFAVSPSISVKNLWILQEYQRPFILKRSL